MELNRDVSILVNQWFLNTSTKHVHILDGLAASGIRGIRLAHELSGDFEVTINDWNDQSFALIQQNIQKNLLAEHLRVPTRSQKPPLRTTISFY